MDNQLENMIAQVVNELYLMKEQLNIIEQKIDEVDAKINNLLN